MCADPHLKVADLSETHITDLGVAKLNELQQLGILDLSRTQVIAKG